jgi:hypothetical protein
MEKTLIVLRYVIWSKGLPRIAVGEQGQHNRSCHTEYPAQREHLVKFYCKSQRNVPIAILQNFDRKKKLLCKIISGIFKQHHVVNILNTNSYLLK